MLAPDHNFYMRKALEQAKMAFDKDEVPVGAVIVYQNQIIARAYNLTETLNDVTAHAEMQAITVAADFIGGKYLSECTLYVTLEPCVMCAGATYWAQLAQIVFGAFDPKRGFSLQGNGILHPKTQVIGGILETESSELLKAFFKKKRE
jgi:tRNA(adenine34) deaminase